MAAMMRRSQRIADKRGTVLPAAGSAGSVGSRAAGPNLRPRTTLRPPATVLQSTAQKKPRSRGANDEDSEEAEAISVITKAHRERLRAYGGQAKTSAVGAAKAAWRLQEQRCRRLAERARRTLRKRSSAGGARMNSTCVLRHTEKKSSAEAHLKHHELLMQTTVHREAALVEQWHREVQLLREHLEEKHETQAQQRRNIEEAASKSGDLGVATVTAPTHNSARGASRGGQPSGRGASQRGKNSSTARSRRLEEDFKKPTAARAPTPAPEASKRLRTDPAAARTDVGRQTAAAAPAPARAPGGASEAVVLKAGGDGARVENNGTCSPMPGSPRAPFVEFVGAPVGKGAKVPTGLWPFPAEMMKRSRGRTVD